MELGETSSILELNKRDTKLIRSFKKGKVVLIYITKKTWLIYLGYVMLGAMMFLNS